MEIPGTFPYYIEFDRCALWNVYISLLCAMNPAAPDGAPPRRIGAEKTPDTTMTRRAPEFMHGSPEPGIQKYRCALQPVKNNSERLIDLPSQQELRHSYL
jgi:hypothetical protein